VHDAVEFGRSFLDVDLPGVDLRNEQQITDDAQEPVGVAVDDREELTLLVGQAAGLSVEHQLEVSADRRDRRSQLMRDGHDQPVVLRSHAANEPDGVDHECDPD
jgi:hypothetical protein